MKDTLRSRSEGLIQKHPKLFNVFLILALISLVFASAFLLSDIMSFKSNPAQKGPLCAFSLKLPNECKTTIVKTWQEKGVNLIGQLKSFLGIEGPAKNLDKDPSRDKARALLARNRLAKANEARLRTENLSNQEIPMDLANSSRAQTYVQPSQSTNIFTVRSDESEGGSDYPYYSEGDSSSKDLENDTQPGAVASNIFENRPPSGKSVSNDSVIDETILNESDTNEAVVNDSVIGDSTSSESATNEQIENNSFSNDSVPSETTLNDSAANKSAVNGSSLNESEVESQIRQSNTNQSQMYTNLSSNTPESLKATDRGSNGTGNNSYPLGSKNTDISSDKLSRELQSIPESNPNSAGSNSSEPNDGVDQDRNRSAASTATEFNKMNNGITNQNGTSNGTSNHIIPYKKNDSTFDVLTSSGKGIPHNSVLSKTSNTTSGQVIESFDRQSNSPPAGKTISAGNSTSQSQGPKQTYNQSESKPLLDGSSTPHNPLPDNKTEGLQNNLAESTVNGTKKVSTNSASAQSQQSKIGKTNSASRFRTLKVPTPSWMTKA